MVVDDDEKDGWRHHFLAQAQFDQEAEIRIDPK
jgi:hypothetical protein